MEVKTKKERFQFKLTINENIICQRYFRINNFNEKSLTSHELTETIKSVTRLIQEDLNSKTRIALWYLYDENYKTSNKKDKNVWDIINEEFIERTTDENVFKFTFIVDGKDVYSVSWDGNVYPSFVRNSVDITNKKFRYDTNDRNLDYTNLILKKMCVDKVDLVPEIIRPICEVCSKKTQYYKDRPLSLKEWQSKFIGKLN